MKKVTLLKVFIASPSDVNKERDEVEKLISQWNNQNVDEKNTMLMPIRWENNSSASYRLNEDGQSVINEQLLDDSDILIAIFGNTIGTRNKSTGKTGTQEEIDYFYAKNQDHLGVFFVDAEDVPKKHINDYPLVKEYQEELQEKGLYDIFDPYKINIFLTREVAELVTKYDKEEQVSDLQKSTKLNEEEQIEYLQKIDQESVEKELDRKVLKELKRVLYESSAIQILKNEDFGGPFSIELMKSLEEFKNRGDSDPELEFLDPELESLKIDLHNNITKLFIVLLENTWPLEKNSSFVSVPREWRINDPNHFEKIIDIIHTQANYIAKIYDDLIRLSRKKLITF